MPGEKRGGMEQTNAWQRRSQRYRTDETWIPETRAAMIELTAIPRLQRGLTGPRRSTFHDRNMATKPTDAMSVQRFRIASKKYG
jgi:hypothetical protein